MGRAAEMMEGEKVRGRGEREGEGIMGKLGWKEHWQ